MNVGDQTVSLNHAFFHVVTKVTTYSIFALCERNLFQTDFPCAWV